MGRQVNQTELSEILGVSDVTIWEWQKQDPPLPMARRGERGQQNLYDTADVIAWMVARAEARARTDKPQDRLARAQAERVELENEKTRGELVPASEVEPVWRERVLTAAAYMVGRASRLAAILEATPSIEQKRQVLKEEDAAFLTKLGVDGARMQAEIDALLEQLSTGEAEAFLRRLSGGHDKPGAAGPGQPSVGAPGAPEAGPAEPVG